MITCVCVCVCVEDEPSIQHIHDHFKMLRQSVQYSRSLYVVFLESNMTWKWPDRIMKEIISTYSPLMIPTFDKTPAMRPGCWTSEELKEAGWIRTNEILRDDRLLIGRELICSSTWKDGKHRTEQQRKEETVQMLFDEFRNYKKGRKEPPPNSRDFGKFKVYLSGKAGGKKDDLVTSTYVCLELMNEVQNDRAFQQFVNDEGLAT
jgi:hypothetical protein